MPTTMDAGLTVSGELSSDGCGNDDDYDGGGDDDVSDDGGDDES